MTECRIVTNGKMFRIQSRSKVLWWWSSWISVCEPANPWAPWEYNTFEEAHGSITDMRRADKIALRPWLPVDEHGQAIAPSNVAAQARQDGRLPPWPHPPEQQLEEIEQSTGKEENHAAD